MIVHFPLSREDAQHDRLRGIAARAGTDRSRDLTGPGHLWTLKAQGQLLSQIFLRGHWFCSGVAQQVAEALNAC